MDIRYAKLLSHLSSSKYAAGHAIRLDITIILTYSTDNMATIAETLAPRTFRMPISFVRRSAEYADSPKRPNDAITTAMMANRSINRNNFSSDRYIRSRREQEMNIRRASPVRIWTIPSPDDPIRVLHPRPLSSGHRRKNNYPAI